MNALLTVSDAVVGWQQPTLGPLSLQLMAGEVLGLTGPNGIGKSTLLAAVAGRARVFSGLLERAPGARLSLQTQDVPPVMGLPLSGRNLLTLTGAPLKGLPDWLQDRLDLRLDQLSGGQRHYLTLWAILEAPAELILLDEPSNHLDQAGTRHLARHLRERAAAGAGIIVVSHDAEFVAEACDRTVQLEQADA